MDSWSIEIISGPFGLSEGPFWDKNSKSLYFVDIDKSTVHKYVPKTGLLTSAKVGDKSVSIIIPIKDQIDRFLITYGTDLAVITWNGESENISDIQIIVEVDPRKTNRINDGKVNPQGVLFLGSMSIRSMEGEQFHHKGSLYCYRNNQVIELIRDVTISNGLAWTPDGKKFYYIDSFRFAITRYDCDVTKQEILTNETTVYKMEKSELCGPDGMTIDNEGKLWIAFYGGYSVIRIDPDSGELLKKITLPSANITSVTFGGDNLDELYVTSGFSDLDGHEEQSKNHHSGYLFKITGLGVRGTENVPFELKSIK